MSEQNKTSNKTRKIIYWIATIWRALGMTSTGIVQLMKTKEEVDMMNHLGYPLYFLTIIGIWKISGVIAGLIPRFPLLKEWAYAGFTFLMTGALFSHLAMHDSVSAIFPALLLLVLTFLSWWLRPASRSFVFLTFKKTGNESRG